MKIGGTQPGMCGFALMEALVALLLLATATIGAGAAMIQALSGQRAALLRTQAADLAADLAEALRAAPDAGARAAEILTWQVAVARRLPQSLSQAIHRPPAGFDIQLQWRDGRAPAHSGLTLAVTLVASPDET
jgi:Tfp pilus assembly protein PilV